MIIHGVSENHMNNLHKIGVAGYVGCTERAKKEPVRPREDAVIGFMQDFLAEKHGRAQKIPNPRSSKEEWHLPVWMTKTYVYKFMVADWPKDASGKFPSRKFLIPDFEAVLVLFSPIFPL